MWTVFFSVAIIYIFFYFLLVVFVSCSNFLHVFSLFFLLLLVVTNFCAFGLKLIQNGSKKAYAQYLSSSSIAYVHVNVTKSNAFTPKTHKGTSTQNWISKQKSFNNFARTLLKRCMGADFKTFNYQLTKPSAKLVSTNATICKQWSNKILPSSTLSVSNLRSRFFSHSLMLFLLHEMAECVCLSKQKKGTGT